MKKKIGLLAVKTYNYGSLLQTYALQKVLDNVVAENEIIEYKKTNMLKQASRLLNIPLLKQTLHKIMKKLYIKLFRKELLPILSSRTKAFDEFTKRLRFSECYVGRRSLTDSTSKYDAFVLGSDQVWNPMNLGGDFFTMTFIPDNITKIAYAPSFGVSKIPGYQVKKTRTYLDRINYLSVREVSGQRIIKELIGKEAKLVVDPTILLDREHWDTLKGEKIIEKPYIFCYFLGNIASHRAFANRLKTKTGMKIVTIPHVDQIVKADFGFGDEVPENIGPVEFINLISNASYVCTDSFHGTVFSILYERTFFTFNRYSSSSGDSTNSRLSSILELMNLQSRYFDSSKEIDDSDMGLIDYSVAKKRIAELRADSLSYLENSLNEKLVNLK